MIGGNRTRKNAVGENTCSRFQLLNLSVAKQLMSNPMDAPRKTTTTLSGKYWNRVSSIVCINRMPIAMTHSTKNMAIELLCSCSTAFGSSCSPIFFNVVFSAALTSLLLLLLLLLLLIVTFSLSPIWAAILSVPFLLFVLLFGVFEAFGVIVDDDDCTLAISQLINTTK